MDQHKNSTDVLYDVRDGVAYITFNRPKQMNATSDETRTLLPEYIAKAEEAPEVRCVVLTGTGRAFCAGTDVKRLASPDYQKSTVDTLLADVESLRDFQRRTVYRLHIMPKPTIAAVNGYAIGAGLSFAMSCDFRVAARSAQLSAGFGRIGVTGDTGLIWFLTRAIGRSATLDWLYTSAMISADEAARLGVVNRVFDDEEFISRTHELATQIAAGSSRTNAGMKANVELALQVDLATSLHQEALTIYSDLISDDHREAIHMLLKSRALDSAARSDAAGPQAVSP